jgi:hypothetical protein
VWKQIIALRLIKYFTEGDEIDSATLYQLFELLAIA